MSTVEPVKNTNVVLLKTNLSVGTTYTVEYLAHPASVVTSSFTGKFMGWDAMRDKFEFVTDDEHTAVQLIVRGDDVLKVSKVEVDPSGLDASQAGAKLDHGKMYADDILAGFSRALLAVAEVGTFGANKYSLGGWMSVEDGERRYRNAAARHRLYRQMGEEIDPDSNLPHEFHEAWNVLAALTFKLKIQE